MPPPDVNGTWTGVIEPITLYAVNDPHFKYQGSVLRITGGPQTEPMPAELGGGRLPILVRPNIMLRHVSPADELPIGKTVEIQGNMSGGDARTPRQKGTFGTRILNRVLIEEGGRTGEHFLIVTGEIKVLPNQPAAATRPATNPAQPDLSTPLSAVRAYATAWQEGDAKALRALIHTDTPQERRVADAFTRFIDAADKSDRMARQTLGLTRTLRLRAALEPMFTTRWGQLILKDLNARPDDPDVEIDGDRVVVGVEPVGAVHLRRIDGRWLVVVIPPDQLKDQIDQSIRMFDVLTQRHEQLAREIEAGKYKTGDEAAEAFMAGLR